MNEDKELIYMLIRGFEYEGSGVMSLHRSEQGARDAADAYMSADMADHCYSEYGWEEVELHPSWVPAGVVAEWACGGQYLRVAYMELFD